MGENAATKGIIAFYLIFGLMANFFISDEGLTTNAYTNNQTGEMVVDLNQDVSILGQAGFIIEFAVDTLELFIEMAALQVHFTDNSAVNTFINTLLFAPLTFSILYEGVNLIRGRG